MKKKTENNNGCGTVCTLSQGCISPRMPYTGEGRKKILIIAEAPGRSEDEEGVQLIGDAGQLLRGLLREAHVRLDKDCWKTNVIRCRPPSNRTPKPKEINCCKPYLFETITKLKPEKIFLLGKIAMHTFMEGRESVTDVEKWVGRKIPDRKWNCWVYPMYHPSYLLRNPDDDVLFNLFDTHLDAAVRHKPDPDFFKKTELHVECIQNAMGATIYLQGLNASPPDELAFDIETIGLSPWSKKAKILSIALSCEHGKAVSFPIFDDPAFKKELRKLLQGPSKKIAHSLKFEDKWIKVQEGYCVRNWKWDTQINAHIIDNRKGITGLKFQGGVHYGYLGYDKPVKKFIKDMSKCPIDLMLQYNGMDAGLTFMLYQDQKEILADSPARKLFHAGTVELSKVEMNGIHIDMEYYQQKRKKLERQIEFLQKEIANSKEVKEVWKKEFNPNSSKQLQELLFEKLNFKSRKETAKGNPSTDIEVLASIRNPFVKKIVQLRKLDKINGTYLSNFMTNAENGFLHPQFWLSTARSFRSSSSNPNFQNVPVRDAESQKIIRTGILPRPGRFLVETDYSGIEVRISACCHKDPVMLKYINDPTTDMHRDQARELFLKTNITKEERYLAKNGFVFPEFYGDYYGQIAPRIWKDLPSETKIHLQGKGIRTYKDFERHVEDVENSFWNERFVVYNEWKKEQWEKFQKLGYVELFTGFRAYGPMRRNNVLNMPIQGPAFHCLLWSLIQLNRFIRKEKLQTLIIGQIHDSIVKDVVPDEWDVVYSTLKRIMCRDIREEWDWIIVPLDSETKVSEIDGNWANMKTYERK